jgi:aldehyde:ferredoxin oxidoreductase
MANGYTGKLLRVDMDHHQVTEEPLNQEYAQAYIGGSGLASRYLNDLVTGKTDPLGADNPLMFMTGPLTATNAPCCGRFTVCARSPLTGFWGEANSGGIFGPTLKFTGYDGIIITGSSTKPVYLEITEDKAELKDASRLWGMDSYQTQEIIKKEVGRPKASVACIGIAGEKKSNMAAIINDQGRAAARTGMGAVMGSKQLKAIVVSGDSKPTIAEEDTFKEAVREAHLFLKGDIQAQMFRLGGTAFYMDIGMMYGDIPVRYYTQGNFDISNLTGAAMSETILIDNVGCYRCPIACGRKTRLERYRVFEADGPEYETIAALGTLLLIDDLTGIAYVGHLCNLYGLDTISTGATIAFATYLFENGVLNVSDTDGMKLKWGDIDTVINLVGKIARREGFGDILADGSLSLAKQYGVEETAVQVKGLEVAMHDPRAFSGMAVAYATSPRGGCHLHSDFFMLEVGSEIPDLGILSSLREQWAESSKEKAQMVARYQDWRSIHDALVLCKFANLPANLITRLLNSATGWQTTPQELLKSGERIFNMKRLLNLKFGLTPEDDRLPSLLLEPLPDGGAAGNVPDIKLLLDEYYRFRSWDKTTGKPANQKLMELGLNGYLS